MKPLLKIAITLFTIAFLSMEMFGQQSHPTTINSSDQSEKTKEVLEELTNLIQLGDFEKGKKVAQEAIKNSDKTHPSYTADIADIYLSLSNLHLSNSESDSALIVLGSAEEIIQQIEDSNTKEEITKKILAAKSKVYTKMGQLMQSIHSKSKLLDIAYEEKDSNLISEHNINIAMQYFRLGDYGKCKYHVEKSLAVNLKRYKPTDQKMIRDFSRMGLVSMKLRDYETAEEYYKKTASLIKNTMGYENLEMASLIFNLGVNHYQKYEFDDAIVKFKESLKIRKKLLPPIHKDVAHSTQIIGTTYLNQYKFAESIQYLEKALAIRLKIGNILDPEMTRIYTNLAICHQYTGNIESAQTYINSAYETIGYDHSTPYDFDKLTAPFMFSNPLEIDIQLAIDRYSLDGKEEAYAILLEKHRLVDSIQNYIKFYFDDSRSRIIASSKFAKVSDELMMGYHERYLKANDKSILPIAFNLFEKNKNTLMYEKLGEESSGISIGMPNEIIDQKIALEDSIAHYEDMSYSASGEALSEILKKVDQAKTAYYDHLAMIKKEYPKFYENVYDFPTIDLNTYAAGLTENEATLSYFFGNSKTFALLIKHNGSEIIDCGESIVVDSLITIFRDDISKLNNPNAYKSTAKQLYSLLIEPCDLSETTHLNILSDNVLGMFPFEVLIDPNSEEFLMEKFSTSYHYSASQQMKTRARKPRKGSLLAMAPVFESENENVTYASLLDEDIFRDNLTALPNSENEINTISSIFGGKNLSKKAATETAFKQWAPKSHVFHLATHGFVNHNKPDNSRLYFYQEPDSTNDGKLHAYEIVNMDLSADLVTLSACNTGIGAIQNGEGVASLGKAFAFAGCPNQLISLWPANDKSTTSIMTNFYQNIDNGDRKAQALYNAKKQYLETAPTLYRHPYYWSGFVYYGNDEPLQISKSGSINWAWGAIGLAVIGIFLFFYQRQRQTSDHLK